MSGQVILLNGASSSGKTTLGRALQDVLPGNWLLFGIDDLIRALPTRMLSGDGIEFGEGGEVSVGAAFRELERAWMEGLAATVQAGASVIVDDVFLSGVATQKRWKDVLHGISVYCVGVHCDLTVAETREKARSDRTVGMHRQQAGMVHQGVRYDLEVDTSRSDPAELAREIRLKLGL